MTATAGADSHAEDRAVSRCDHTQWINGGGPPDDRAFCSRVVQNHMKRKLGGLFTILPPSWLYTDVSSRDPMVQQGGLIAEATVQASVLFEKAGWLLFSCQAIKL